MSPRTDERRQQVNVRLTAEGRAFLEAEAARLGVTPSAVMRAALRWYSSLPESKRKVEK